MKKLLIIIIFGLLILVSVTHSSKVYRFYMKTYYTFFYDEEILVKKGWSLYDDGKHKELEKYIKPLLNIYVSSNELKQIAGLNYIKLGEPVKGAELFAASFENGGGQTADFVKILKILFQSGNYGEVVFFYDRNIMRSNVNMSFYYGASLFHLGRNKEALASLVEARKNGFIGEEIDYYTGLALEGEGRLREAADMMKRAYDYNRQNRDVKKALIRVYRKSGEFEKAEFILRTR